MRRPQWLTGELVVQWVAAILCLAALIAIAGCASSSPIVATDVQVIERPVPVPCRFAMPGRPVPHVELVQSTGRDLGDLVVILRAMEAELEERIAYEARLEAAARACLDDP